MLDLNTEKQAKEGYEANAFQVESPKDSWKSFEAKEANAKWLNNDDENVEEVYGFNKNAELVNGRAALIGFLMLILTEFVFHGDPVTRSIFAIN